MKAGYPARCWAPSTSYKAPTNYHWPTDTPDHVDYDTVAGAVTLCTALSRRLAAAAA